MDNTQRSNVGCVRSCCRETAGKFEKNYKEMYEKRKKFNFKVVNEKLRLILSAFV